MPYFRAFSAFSVTATNFMNSITFVMNHLISYFDISICHCSNRTLCYHLFKFHGFNYGYFLGGVCSILLNYKTHNKDIIPCFQFQGKMLFSDSSLAHSLPLIYFWKINISQKPDRTFEAPSSFGLAHQVLFIDHNIKAQAIAVKLHLIELFSCEAVDFLIDLQNFS